MPLDPYLWISSGLKCCLSPDRLLYCSYRINPGEQLLGCNFLFRLQ